MNPYLALVKASAFQYFGWDRFTSPQNMRGYHMKVARKDIECYGAMFRYKKRQYNIAVKMTQNWKGLHP